MTERKFKWVQVSDSWGPTGRSYTDKEMVGTLLQFVHTVSGGVSGVMLVEGGFVILVPHEKLVEVPK